MIRKQSLLKVRCWTVNLVTLYLASSNQLVTCTYE